MTPSSSSETVPLPEDDVPAPFFPVHETPAVSTQLGDAGTPTGALLPRIKVDVFTETGELQVTLEKAAADRRAARTEFSFWTGSFAAAAAQYRETLSPDLVVVEQRGWVENLDWLIEALAEVCQPTTRVLVVGDRNDVVLYRHLIRAGVSDYLFQPIEPLVFLDAIRSIFLVDGETAELGTVIAFVGARGGVGSSTLAQNVAALVSHELATTTLLIDADLGFGTAALQFDITPARGLAEALTERSDLDNEVLERLVHWRDKRLGILAAPDRVGQMSAPDPDAMRQVVDQARRVAQFVVLDLPHGWAPWTVEALATADGVVIVATADLPCLRNARTLGDLLAGIRPNDGPAALVLNRLPVRGKPAVSPEEFSRILDCRIAARIPFDGAVGTAEMAGTVLSEFAPKSEIVQIMRTFAAAVSDKDKRGAEEPRRASWFGRLFRRTSV